MVLDMVIPTLDYSTFVLNKKTQNPHVGMRMELHSNAPLVIIDDAWLEDHRKQRIASSALQRKLSTDADVFTPKHESTPTPFSTPVRTGSHFAFPPTNSMVIPSPHNSFTENSWNPSSNENTNISQSPRYPPGLSWSPLNLPSSTTQHQQQHQEPARMAPLFLPPTVALQVSVPSSPSEVSASPKSSLERRQAHRLRRHRSHSRPGSLLHGAPMLPIVEEDSSQIEILCENDSTTESGVESDSGTSAVPPTSVSASTSVSAAFVPNEDQERQQLLALQFSNSPEQSPRQRSRSVGHTSTPTSVYYEKLPNQTLPNLNTSGFDHWKQEVQRLQQQLPHEAVSDAVTRLIHLQLLVDGGSGYVGTPISRTPTTSSSMTPAANISVHKRTFDFSPGANVQTPGSASFSPCAAPPAAKKLGHRRHHSIAGHGSEYYSAATPTKTKSRNRKKRALSATASARLKNKAKLQDAYAHLLKDEIVQDDAPRKKLLSRLSSGTEFPTVMEQVVMAT